MNESPDPPAEFAPVPAPTASALPPRAGILGWLPWLAALLLAGLVGWMAQLYLGARAQMIALREEEALADIEARSLQQELQAERIVAVRRLADATAGNLTAGGTSGLDYIAMVAPAARPSPATAVVVWDRSHRAGLLDARDLPALPAGEEYQLWIVWKAASAPACLRRFGPPQHTRDLRLSLRADTPAPASGPARFFLRIGHRGIPPTPDGPVVLQSP